MQSLKPLLAVPVCLFLIGCASFDQQDVSLLGAATEQNIAMHSVRDVALPNELAVESGKGGSAATAVDTLRASKREGGAPRGGNR